MGNRLTVVEVVKVTMQGPRERPRAERDTIGNKVAKKKFEMVGYATS